MISVESNFDHAAVSQKGARGLMQLMPATASLIGVRDPHDPDENIDAGASHLRAMLDTARRMVDEVRDLVFPLHGLD